jgi:predicted secreted protein
MKTVSMLFILSWITLGLAIAASSQESKAPSYNDPGKPIDVSAGQEFRIVLEANPTTGYVWKMSGTPDDSVVKLVGDEYRTPSVSGPRTGVGGTHFWTFRGVGPGETRITLTYSRPWEKVPPLKEVTFTVIVR